MRHSLGGVKRTARGLVDLLRAALALTIGLGLAAWPASPVPAAAQVAGPPVEQSVLPNGLTVVTEQRPGSRAAGIALAVRAGSRFEDERTDSAAHLLEHTYFQGTPSRPSNEALARPITSLGGSLATWAGWELLRIEAAVPADHLDVAVDVISDMLLNSTHDPDKLEKERRVILAELADIHDTPASLVGQVLRRELFAGQALSRQSSGSEEGVRRLSRADMLAFRDRWIGANRAVVAVVSPYSHAEVAGLLGGAFGAFQPVDAPAEPAADPGRTRSGRVDVAAGSEQAQVAIGMPVPGIRSADRYALTVLEASLRGFSGRLTGEIREKRGLAYRTSASTSLLSDVGLFAVGAGTDPASAEQVIELLGAELGQLRAEPLSEIELNRAKGLATGGRLVATETAAARSVDLAIHWGLGVPEPLEQFEGNVAAVTAADVQRVAQAYLLPERMLAVVVQP